MLLTREKERYRKEVKLRRLLYDTDWVEFASNHRNTITDSRHAAPSGRSPVFMANGAKWIWKRAEDCDTGSTQILDLHYCKKWLYSFSKEYFTSKEAFRWIEADIEKLKTERVNVLLEESKELSVKNKSLQKRMKLSGQRWSAQEAKQMPKLRICYKSGSRYLIRNLIAGYKNVTLWRFCRTLSELNVTKEIRPIKVKEKALQHGNSASATPSLHFHAAKPNVNKKQMCKQAI
jgi:regulator of replication initiation timing